MFAGRAAPRLPAVLDTDETKVQDIMEVDVSAVAKPAVETEAAGPEFQTPHKRDVPW